MLAALASPARGAIAGPSIVTDPVPFATVGQAITVTAQATCDYYATGGCSARVFYQTSTPGQAPEVFSGADPNWASLSMSRDAGYNVNSYQSVYTFTATLPASIADTRGVDYIVKVTDGVQVGYSPGTPAANGLGQNKGFRTSAWHVYVTNPANIQHVPVASSPFRTAIPITAYGTCATPCTARLWWRRTGLLTPAGTSVGQPTSNASDGDTTWTNAVMSASQPAQTGPTDQYGLTTWQFSQTIPSAYVDTRGVDYAIQLSDTHTTTWWPGTPYQGYVSPVDGFRAGWQHVHVLNPVVAVHEQTTYTTTQGTPQPLLVYALCWTRTCSATASYHAFGGVVHTIGLSKKSDLELTLPDGSSADLMTFGTPDSAPVPGYQVCYPTFSYSFRVTDGYTAAYSPGTVYNGYYVTPRDAISKDGTAAGEYSMVVNYTGQPGCTG